MTRSGMSCLLGAALSVAVAGGCAGSPGASSDTGVGTPPDATAAESAAARVEVVGVYGRGPGFTQGLELLDDGRVLHSTGRYGESRLEVLGADGVAEVSADLPADEFGEGVTVVGDSDSDIAYQLTWRSGVVHTWSVPELAPGPELRIAEQGWGLCYDRTRDVLWLSDGSAHLQALTPDGLLPGDRVEVTERAEPVPMLNELECAEGQVWANIWHDDDVVRIDPASGEVTDRVDLGSVVEREDATDEEDVLNGIAYDDSDGTFLVTGKNWKHIYRVAWPMG